MARRKPKKIMGIDEAGRGPVLGPMVVCGVHVDEATLEEVESMGLKDSKKLSAKKREEFDARLRTFCSFELYVLHAHEIDARVSSEDTLNQLEVNCFSHLIKTAKPHVAYVDACDVNAERFGVNIKKNLDFELEIVSQHEADSKFPIVSAASILAKVHRDSLIEGISEAFGENVGSGYPADPVTIEFLKAYYKKNKKLPDCARKTWKTSSAVIADCQQARLFQFD